MKAVFFESNGGPEVLRYGDFPEPTPGAGEVRVRVRACSLNYLDVFSRRGMPGIRIELPGITGGDCAGEVDAIGSGVEGWKPGQRVLVDPVHFERGSGRMRMLGENCRGAFAESCVVDASQLIALPDDVRDEDAACLPVAYGTSHRSYHARRAQGGREDPDPRRERRRGDELSVACKARWRLRNRRGGQRRDVRAASRARRRRDHRLHDPRRASPCSTDRHSRCRRPLIARGLLISAA